MGDKLRLQAIQARDARTLFGFGRKAKLEEAVDSFAKAGNAFKFEKRFQEAGDAYLEAAKCALQTDTPNDACNHYVEAGNSFKMVSPMDAVNAYKLAIDMYNANGRFATSARYYKEVAEIYEKENNFAEAIAIYRQAAEVYEADNKKSTATESWKKVATLASQSDDLRTGAEIFARLASDSMESKLGQFSAKAYYLQAALCHLAAGDSVATANMLNTAKNRDFSFATSRECDFLQKLIAAFDGFNAEEFAQACADFDRISPLDPWKTTMLLKAKRFIGDHDGGEPDLS